MGTVGIDVSSPGRFAKAAVKTGKMLAKAMVRSDKGYLPVPPSIAVCPRRGPRQSPCGGDD